MLFGLWVALHGVENVLVLAQKPDFAPLLQQNLCDGGQLKLPTGCLGMHSHCLDPLDVMDQSRACHLVFMLICMV